MEANISDSSQKKTAQTLVFIDLETTGLPHFIGPKNVHITELACIAVDRAEFENNNKDIRIINKLSLCFKPRSNISTEAIHLTGLCNASLQFQEVFSPTSVQLVKLFLQRLNQPACLLAHNGRRFDFPVLQAELNNIDETLNDVNIFCADTIDAFRSILSKNKVSEINTSVQSNNDLNNVPFTEEIHTASLTEESIETLLCKDMDVFEHLIPDTEFNNEMQLNNKRYEAGNSEQTIQCNDKSVLMTSLLKTIPQSVNETTPKNLTESVVSKRTTCRNCKANFRRKLFPTDLKGSQECDVLSQNCTDMPSNITNTGSKQNNKVIKNRMSYSLPSLYKHFFNSPLPLSHFAEADTISLLKISHQLRNEFLKWIDDNMIPFESINPLW